MNDHSPYRCDTPGCDGWQEVITPDGYVCRVCANALERQYESKEPIPDGGVVTSDANTLADELETADDPGTLELPHSFLVDASGPVTRVTERGDDTIEKVRADVTIQRHLETLSEFADFWKLRNKRRWKAAAVETLLDSDDELTTYELTEDHIDSWDVVVDGRVEAYVGLAETMIDYDGDDPRDSDLPKTIADRLRLAGEGHRDVDHVVTDFARDLRTSELWGRGVDLAYINAKHAQRKDVADDLANLLEDLEGSA
ncbi:hypothetical protein [Natrialbaceae archaeon AArc-T1-2]|uniref:hypothetical protein n=1 Tax=Natrialbaceae archaeon AArc-T1-2 TaxID=3053904 RepID=UPI00255AC1CA|nr:hypothetical protein [Natrialbaceae archaeon AArc-T1-2]WIV67521.1 hypothetical protein QQ977_01980 [Natrialbaceae archaeon AArc-T1-2]